MIYDAIPVKDFKLVAGVDEVGRGALAGPLVVASCILPKHKSFLLADSKKLTKNQRERLYNDLMQSRVVHTLCFMEAQKIDELNIHNATLLAMKQAVLALQHVDCVLFDGLFIPDFDFSAKKPHLEAIKKGDETVPAIAAAAIIAKVTRDRFMESIAKKYPQYGFEKNVGYGTKEHIDAIKTYGPTPLHRRSFNPLKTMLEI